MREMTRSFICHITSGRHTVRAPCVVVYFVSTETEAPQGSGRHPVTVTPPLGTLFRPPRTRPATRLTTLPGVSLFVVSPRLLRHTVFATVTLRTLREVPGHDVGPDTPGPLV